MDKEKAEESLDIIRINECEARPSLTTSRFKRVFQEIDSLRTQLEACKKPIPCSVCAGTGKPVSKRPCVCGGSGTIHGEMEGLRQELLASQSRLDKAKNNFEGILNSTTGVIFDAYGYQQTIKRLAGKALQEIDNEDK